MNPEYIILKIIKDTGLSRKEILKMIENKKNGSKKIDSDKVALYTIARNLCIDL